MMDNPPNDGPPEAALEVVDPNVAAGELAVMICALLTQAGCDEAAEVGLLALARSAGLVLGRMSFVDRARLKQAFIRQVNASTQEVIDHLAKQSKIIVPPKPKFLN